jgi:hypothetical protein
MERTSSLTCTVYQCETGSMFFREQNQGKNTVPVDNTTIRILRSVSRNRRQSIDECLLKLASGPITGYLDCTCGETKNLDCFTISDIVKEPGTACLHCQTLPGHFKQRKRFFLFFRIQGPNRMIPEEFLDGFG